MCQPIKREEEKKREDIKRKVLTTLLRFKDLRNSQRSTQAAARAQKGVKTALTPAAPLPTVFCGSTAALGP